MRKLLLLSAIVAASLGAGLSQRIIIPDPPVPVPRPQPGLFELELKELKADVQIDEGSATTTLDQVFYNPTAHQLQGEYLFPLPKEVAVQQFSMFIDGKEVKGELLDAKKAKEIYEDIVRRFQDPALLEFSEQGLARMRVFPIQPHSQVRIKLVYQHFLPEDNRTKEYAIPFSNTRQKVKTAALRIRIQSSDPLKAIYSPTHAVEVNRTGDREATAGMEIEDSALGSSFQLFFQTARNILDASLLTYRETGETKGFFSVNLSPGYADQASIAEKDIVLIVDASGSMAGEKMEQARKALQFCIDKLGPKDGFNIVRFSTEANRLFDKLEEANSANKAKALDYVKKMEAIGGTNVEEAFQLAFQGSNERPGRPLFILFFTDGKPTIGETAMEPLLKRISEFGINKTRVFTIGIGTELNAQLLDRLTEQTRGYRVYVAESEDIEQKVSDFYLKIAYPVLTDIEWKVEGGVKVADVYPKKLPDLFRGESLALFGRYEGKGAGKLKLSGKMNGAEVSYSFDLQFPEEENRNAFLPPLWGTRAVGYLLEQIRLHGESKELVDEVVRLAKKYGIITPYTSYLILEDEAMLIGQNRIREDDAIFAPRMTTQDRDRQSKEYRDAVSEEGAGSVRASDELQQLNQTSNLADAQVAKSRMQYGEANRNLAEEVVRVQGRALYRNESGWQDGEWTEATQNNNNKVNRVQFNTTAYFRLLDEQPDTAPFLSLGQNVRFFWKGEWWEVYL